MESDFSKLIRDSRPYPLLGQSFSPEDYCAIDMSKDNSALNTGRGVTYEATEAYLEQVLEQTGARVAYGGYGEERALYGSSDHFDDGASEPRTIHLGLDFWAPAGTAVYAPLSGQVHSFQYNHRPLDYGATIILRHELQNRTFHTLYGHLSLSSIASLREGLFIARGTAFTTIGHPDENGGWAPHLHFQVIYDMEYFRGDYPGVATKTEAPGYLENCPDPMAFFVEDSARPGSSTG